MVCRTGCSTHLFARIVGRDVRPGSSKATDASVPEGILKTGTFRSAGFLNRGKLMLGMMMDGWTNPGIRAFKAARWQERIIAQSVWQIA
jgi:hypothetical protein